jgi:diaminohydroxyphosphoribosylaminopyrimidine deaminase/5-amino-6-(5-phosphoribosylamino)uracil reductase
VAHEKHMRAALELAARALGRTSPNPAVGARIVLGNRVLAEGFHEKAGLDHAEVAALRHLEGKAPGADLYTTLEPCDHHGRTGPCTEAIIAAGIKRVIIGTTDPNPKVAGRGVTRLRAAGIEVIEGVLEADCRRLNETYNLAIVERRPFVILKAAMSLDGRIATKKRESKYLTGELARSEVHKLRDRHDAILVGIETVLADDPELTVRLAGSRNPLRVVLDSRLRTPLDSRLVKTAREVPTLILTTDRASSAARKRLEKRGVGVEVVRRGEAGIDLPKALKALFQRELSSVLVEGGSRVHGAFFDAGLVDKVVLFYAPILIGGDEAPGPIGGKGVGKLAKAMRLKDTKMTALGPDWMVEGYPE